MMMRALLREEKGITGLETAIILIAFVIVASIFAYTVISAGIFSSQKAEEAVDSGVEETGSTIKPVGNVVAYSANVTDPDTNSTSTAVVKISFTVANALKEGRAVDLHPYCMLDGDGELHVLPAEFPTGDQHPDQHVAIISYQDRNINIGDAAWTVDFMGGYEKDEDYSQEPGEKATITVWLQGYNGTDYLNGNGEDDPFIDKNENHVSTNQFFKVRMRPALASGFAMERRTPAHLEPVMDLH